jgi:hypothetical protein
MKAYFSLTFLQSTRRLGLLVALNPGVKTISGDTKSRGDLRYRVPLLSDLFYGFNFEFFSERFD